MKLPLNIHNVMHSGQVFSYTEEDGHYLIYSADKMCIAKADNDQNYTIVQCLEEDEDYWHNYFNAEQGQKLAKIFSASSNSFIKEAMDNSMGMTILKQDFWEMIVSYIVSQRNNIPSIKKTLFKLREKYGIYQDVVIDGKKYAYYTFPTAIQLLNKDMSGLSLGYRDKYIKDAVKWYLRDKTQWEKTTHEEKLNILQEIHGVGPKIANCVALFALNDLYCFPVDTWIQKILDSEKITLEDVKEYKQYAGFLNQIIYYYVSVVKRGEPIL